MDKILLVDDDAQMRNVLALYLRRVGFTVLDAATLAEARKLQSKQAPDLTIVDYQLPDGTAFDLLSATRERDGSEAVIVLTGLGTIDLAVRAIKSGAEHFLTKPVDLESLEVLVRRTLDLQRERRQRAVAAVVGSQAPDPFLGDSPAIKGLKELAAAAIESDVPVLILGETGSGKGILARWLHEHGTRKVEPFVDLNCAGLSKELAESELFGHQRGAFTGAVNNKPGLIEVAHKGTLFLDELGDLELAVQPKLLTALEEGSFRRVGETTTRVTDVRLIAATHRNLAAMVKDGRFRDDLLFRINTLTLEIPPLRRRASDIRPLARAVLGELCRRRGRAAPELADDAADVLVRYHWPGNVRELRNVLERALLFCKSDVLDRHTLRFDRSLEPDSDSEPQTLDDAERRHIALVLRQSGGKVDDAAKVLALSRSSLYAKLKKYGIRPADS
ncbi:MAG TPA: sigma-54 dependent transcriptional regulator [Polyangiaceae bacterium]|jgi:DNA-binding NtrC family response regulator|nr:sigma-54 dependent transcriptional regulator [Polyangiaceae bacterium]